MALEEGIGSCALLNVEWDKLTTICSVPDSYELSLLIALGYLDESPVEEPFEGSVKYWKDEQGVLHVPKKKLETVLHWNAF